MRWNQKSSLFRFSFPAIIQYTFFLKHQYLLNERGFVEVISWGCYFISSSSWSLYNGMKTKTGLDFEAPMPAWKSAEVYLNGYSSKTLWNIEHFVIVNFVVLCLKEILEQKRSQNLFYQSMLFQRLQFPQNGLWNILCTKQLLTKCGFKKIRKHDGIRITLTKTMRQM